MPQEATDIPCRGEDMDMDQAGGRAGKMGRRHSEWDQGKDKKIVLMCLAVETYKSKLSFLKDEEED